MALLRILFELFYTVSRVFFISHACGYHVSLLNVSADVSPQNGLLDPVSRGLKITFYLFVSDHPNTHACIQKMCGGKRNTLAYIQIGKLKLRACMPQICGFGKISYAADIIRSNIVRFLLVHIVKVIN